MAPPRRRYLDHGAKTAPILIRGAEALFDTASRPDSLRAVLDDPNHLLWFAVVGKHRIGFASASVLLRPDKPAHLFINEVDVLEGYRRRGVGGALVTCLIEVDRMHGCDCAWLGTAPGNESGSACFASVPGAENGGSFVLYESKIENPGK